MNKYFLAYGSNLCIKDMEQRCPDAKAVGTAMLDGYELQFRGGMRAYLTIDEKIGSRVPAAVWEVSPADERALDYYESHPDLYYKTNMDVTYKEISSERQHSVTAFVYIMHKEFTVGLPLTSYLRTCMEGYGDFSFNKRYITEALNRSIRREGSR